MTEIKQPEATEMIDFTVLPFEKTTGLLQNLGKTLVTELLEEKSCTFPVDHLPPEEARLWIPMKQLKVTDASLSLFRRIGRNLTIFYKGLRAGRIRFRGLFKKLFRFARNVSGGTLSLSISDLMLRSVNGGISRENLTASLRKLLDESFGGVSDEFMPEVFRKGAGSAAWLEPELRKEVADMMTNYFRVRALFTYGDKTVVTLKPETFWTLLALAGTAPEQNMTPHQKEAIKIIRAEGASQALNKKGWAGFWDQWIIFRAIKGRFGRFEEVDGKLLASLSGLPLFSHPEMKPLVGEVKLPTTESKKASCEIATPAWDKEIPEWFHSYMALL